MADSHPLPSLSVVLPNFNHGRHLEKTVANILNQGVPIKELIILDDVSTDNSVEIIKGLAAKYPVIRFIQNEKNLGAGGNVNKGIGLAQGDYVAFPAADDELQPGFLEQSLKLLAKYPQAGMSCSASSFYEPHSGLRWILGGGMADKPRYFSPQELVQLERTKRVLIPSNTVIARRDALLEVGAFRPELRWLADGFAVHAIAFRYGICYHPEPLGHVNVEPNSYFQRGRSDEAAHRKVLERYMDLMISPEFLPEAELMRQGGTFYRLEGCILSVLWRDKRFRRYINPIFLKKHLWYSLQVKLKPYTPAFIGNIYLKLAGYKS